MNERAHSPDLHKPLSTRRRLRLLFLVPLARLRFPIILAAIGIAIVKWDYLSAKFEQATGWKESGGAASGYEFFCPMHPMIIREDNKQKCPICNMPLSKRKKEEQSEHAGLPAGITSRVQLSPYRVVLAGVKTSPVGYQPLAKDITTIGTVEFDERGLRKISARVKGRIDKLIVNETGQLVKKDQDLARFYSPEFATTVETLLNAHKDGRKEAEDTARERLLRWEVDEAQINKIIQDGKPVTHLIIRALHPGHVLRINVREGQSVEDGALLYDIADIRTVWVQAQLYEDDLAFLPKGTHDPTSGVAEKKLQVQAKARAFPGRVFEGTLSFVFPHLDQESRTLAVRFVLDNEEHELRPGMTTTVRLQLDARTIAELPIGKRLKMLDGKVLAVSERCVIDTGDKKIVYRETVPTQYEGVEVTLGPRMTGPGGEVFYPVLDDSPEDRLRQRMALTGGLAIAVHDPADDRAANRLKPDDLVVTNGSFLIDAETKLNPTIAATYIGGSGGKTSEPQIRPSQQSDSLAQFEAALKALSPEKRALARAQKLCPEQNRLLGTMGPIQEIQIRGTSVFLCCNACIKPVKDNPEEILARAADFRKRFGGEIKPKK